MGDTNEAGSMGRQIITDHVKIGHIDSFFTLAMDTLSLGF